MARPARAAFAVLDVETTGLTPTAGDQIIEIAISRLDRDGRVIDEWDTLVNPGHDVDPGPTSLHGITRHELDHAPSFAEIAPELTNRLDRMVIVAHHADFDLAFMATEMQRAGFGMPRVPVICTLRAAVRAGHTRGQLGLQRVASTLGVADRPNHAALGDVQVTAEVWRRLMSRGIEPRRVVRPWTPPLPARSVDWPRGVAAAPPVRRRDVRASA